MLHRRHDLQRPFIEACSLQVRADFGNSENAVGLAVEEDRGLRTSLVCRAERKGGRTNGPEGQGETKGA